MAVNIEGRLQNHETVSSEVLFNAVIDTGIEHAINLIRERHEELGSSEDPDKKLSYHIVPHTIGVINRTGEILSAWHRIDPSLVSARDISLGRFKAAFHDTEQISDTKDADGQLLQKRKRHTGENETKSVEDAMQFLRDANAYCKEHYNTEPISEEEIEAMGGIMITKPSFDGELHTVVQDNFGNFSLLDRALGFADLGGSGMQGAEVALYEAATIFDEDYLGYRQHSRETENGQVLRREVGQDMRKKEASLHNDLTAWIGAQVQFTEGRRTHLEQEVLTLPETLRQPTRNLFTHFDESLEALKGFGAVMAEKTNFSDWSGSLNAIINNPPKALTQLVLQ